MANQFLLVLSVLLLFLFGCNGPSYTPSYPVEFEFSHTFKKEDKDATQIVVRRDSAEGELSIFLSEGEGATPILFDKDSSELTSALDTTVYLYQYLDQLIIKANNIWGSVGREPGADSGYAVTVLVSKLYGFRCFGSNKKRCFRYHVAISKFGKKWFCLVKAYGNMIYALDLDTFSSSSGYRLSYSQLTLEASNVD